MHLIRNNFDSKIDLSDQEFEWIKLELKQKDLRRKEKLLEAGSDCPYLFFVESGCLRSFSLDKRGTEHVIQLATENHWISDLSSFLTQKPGDLFIESLEPSTVYLLHREALDRLFDKVSSLDRYFRILYSRAYVSALGRINKNMAETAEERYKQLLEEQPKVLQRIPLIHISSYLGITPESLSRIRKKISD
ncbi:MAG: Crp/Fnr family transcriptional regulator [Ekhidna sp.]|nr:Crp/Fnr family transcriptional regulator [Ekhidna sp.]